MICSSPTHKPLSHPICTLPTNEETLNDLLLCLIDLWPTRQVSCYPDVSVHTRTPEDELLILACDGVWDVMTSTEAVNTVREILMSGETDMQLVAEELIDLALNKGPCGCILMYWPFNISLIALLQCFSFPQLLYCIARIPSYLLVLKILVFMYLNKSNSLCLLVNFTIILSSHSLSSCLCNGFAPQALVITSVQWLWPSLEPRWARRVTVVSVADACHVTEPYAMRTRRRGRSSLLQMVPDTLEVAVSIWHCAYATEIITLLFLSLE